LNPHLDIGAYRCTVPPEEPLQDPARRTARDIVRKPFGATAARNSGAGERMCAIRPNHAANFTSNVAACTYSSWYFVQ